jgi:hypothetical protein
MMPIEARDGQIYAGPVKEPASPVKVPIPGPPHCQWGGRGVVVKYLKLENNYVVILDIVHQTFITTHSTATF